MESFLHWLGLSTDELKRDPEKARDVVRVTTVHGAKGLEAPIVFLADAGPRGRSPRGRLLWSDPALDGTGAELPLWRAAKAERDGLTEAIVVREDAAELEERRRLLYVALTRARDRLYVAGWLSRRAAGADREADDQEPSWHELVRRALLQQEDVERIERADGEALRLRRGVATVAALADRVAAPVPVALPAWATASAPDEPAPQQALTPSQREDPPPSSPTGAAAADRFQRGLLVHRLLELLPELAPEQRPVAADRLLAGLASEMAPERRADLAQSVLALLALPDLAAVFGPGSRAEQPICGVVGGREIVGQIDRLVVTADEVLVVDLKSNRTPPATVDASPVAYLRQLAAYRTLLTALYPGRRVRAALLWTEAPRLDEIPAELLDRHAPAG